MQQLEALKSIPSCGSSHQAAQTKIANASQWLTKAISRTVLYIGLMQVHIAFTASLKAPQYPPNPPENHSRVY